MAKSLGSKARFDEADLKNLKSFKQVVEQTVSRFEGLDVQVNNAGFNGGLGLEPSPEDFMTSVQNNILYVYAMTHIALQQFLNGLGSILNLGSKVSVTGQGKTSNYDPVNGSISSLTLECGATLVPENVRVNCIISAE